MASQLQDHWGHIYSTKRSEEVSWTQKNQKTAISLIEELQLAKDAQIIDIGGGDSSLVDELLDLGYVNITVLDISHKALERAKKRLGERAQLVNWIVSDIKNFVPKIKYDLWYDRAAFHFLTQAVDQEAYKSKVSTYGNYFILGVFSDNGPSKCSGLPVQRYSRNDMIQLFGNSFQVEKFKNHNHVTPFDTVQSFLFGVFKNKIIREF